MWSILFLAPVLLGWPEVLSAGSHHGLNLLQAVAWCYPIPEGVSDIEKNFALDLVNQMYYVSREPSSYIGPLGTSPGLTRPKYRCGQPPRKSFARIRDYWDNENLERGQGKTQFFNTLEGRRWRQRLGDIAYTLRCQDPAGNIVEWCREDMLSIFGVKNVNIIAETDLQALLDNVCARQTVAKLVGRQASGDLFQIMYEEFALTSCGRQALRGLKRRKGKLPKGNPIYRPQRLRSILFSRNRVVDGLQSALHSLAQVRVPPIGKPRAPRPALAVP